MGSGGPPLRRRILGLTYAKGVTEIEKGELEKPPETRERKTCVACAALIPADARICATCKSYQSDPKICISCAAFIPADARICATCKSYQSDLKVCINCAALIPSDARICATCKSYQQEWRNALVYLGGIASVITIAGSVALFSYSKTQDILAAQGWSDQVYIQSLKYPGEVLISNPGGNSIYVTHFEFYWRTGANQQITIDQSIPKGETKILKLDYLEDRRPDLPIPSASEIETGYFWLSNSTGKAGWKLLSESDPHSGGKCVIRALISRDHPEFKRVSEHYEKHDREKLITENVDAYVDWISPKQSSLMRTPMKNVVIAFRFSPNPGCVQKDWDGDH